MSKENLTESGFFIIKKISPQKETASADGHRPYVFFFLAALNLSNDDRYWLNFFFSCLKFYTFFSITTIRRCQQGKGKATRTVQTLTITHEIWTERNSTENRYSPTARPAPTHTAGARGTH